MLASPRRVRLTATRVESSVGRLNVYTTARRLIKLSDEPEAISWEIVSAVVAALLAWKIIAVQFVLL